MKKFEDIFLKSHEVDFKVNPEVSNVDVRGIIQIINETNIFDKRNKLIKYIWGD
jgi:myosin-crossreactive antigen|tara:strand:- start:750 stop:911 length:162 start_codon:yes stop_codon:yes gene_type:complete